MGGKQDLLVTIMRDAMHELIASARQAVSDAETVADELAGLARAHIIYNGKHILDAYVTDAEIRSLDSANRGRIVKLRDAYEVLWSEVIERGVASGDFRIQDKKLFRFAAIHLCNGVTYWYSPAGPSSLNAIADEFAEYVLAMAGYDPDREAGAAKKKKAGARKGR
jgi:hypothetical protein